MKKILLFLSICYLVSSCTTEKIVSTGKNNEQSKLIELGNRKVIASPSENLANKKNNSTDAKIENENNKKSISKNDCIDGNVTVSISNSDIFQSKGFDYIGAYTPSKDACDVIVLKSGEEINAKVSEVGTSEIKYVKCDNLNGPSYSIKKSDVFMIKYANGTKDIINTPATENSNNTQNNTQSNNQNNSSGYHSSASDAGTGGAVGLVSLLISIIGLFVLTIVVEPIAIVIGIIGLFTDKKNKGFAIAGIITGFVGIFLWLILLAFLLGY